jgi:hypothetical protein
METTAAAKEVVGTNTGQETKATGSSPASPTRLSRRKRVASHESEAVGRYFLAKSISSKDKPELGEECEKETDAMVKSLQTGLPYFIITHYTVTTTVENGVPQIVRQPYLKEVKTKGLKLPSSCEEG